MHLLKVLGALLVALVSSTPDEGASLMQLRIESDSSLEAISCSLPSCCTDDTEVDKILAKQGFLDAILLTSTSSIYTWDGFCSAARALKAINKGLFEGDTEDDHRVAKVVTNIASLLAQCMWESGGDLPWSACDENNQRKDGKDVAACTQREDHQRYDSLIGTTKAEKETACAVDKQMKETASSWATWTKGPLKCVPGTDTAGCCWWGRGAIQMTGPYNFGKLQEQVVEKVSDLKNVDLCTNPGEMCTGDASLKWLGALFYWTAEVQNAAHFENSLDRYVESGFDATSSLWGGATFNDGTGGMVNHGKWDHLPHGSTGRAKYFKKIMKALQSVGVSGGSETFDPWVEDLCGVCSTNCHIKNWADPCVRYNVANQAACEAFESGTWCG